MQANSEKLHIVCDQGKISRKYYCYSTRIGLNNKYLSVDKKRKAVANGVKSKLLTGKYVPLIFKLILKLEKTFL
jgi:hypothetical protein